MNGSDSSIRKRIPIRKRFLKTVLLTTIISIVAVSLTGVFCIRWIRMATEDTITEQLELNLKENIKVKVSSVDAKLEQYEKYIEFVTDYIEDMYENEDEMISRGKLFYAPTDTKEYTLTRVFASDKIKPDDLKNEMLFFSNLEKIWEPIAKRNKRLINTEYLGTKNGLLASYDRFSYMSCPPKGKETIYNYRVSEWYKRGMKENGVFYTGVYMDSQGRGLTITIASGFRDSKGKKAGVACMDFDLKNIYEELFSSGLESGTFTFALDHNGNFITPDSEKIDIQEYTGLTLDELDQLKEDPNGVMEKNDSLYVCIPMYRLGWTLCACVPKKTIQDSIHDADVPIWKAVAAFIVIVLIILLFAVYAVNRTIRKITHPLELLERDIKIISDGDLNYRATVYRNDEIGDITSGMNEMVDRLNFTLKELMSSQQHADAMSKLATLDTLTGIRNKTAFDKQTELLTEELKDGEKEFGFVMVDLNNLKVINDNYGHDKGDFAIRKLCHIICEIFIHSAVFRVGGDEFVVLLKNGDYRNIESLTARFKDKIRLVSEDDTVQPWERVSAAIGYALYDEKLDDGTESVLSRADKKMYQCKKIMKNID